HMDGVERLALDRETRHLERAMTIDPELGSKRPEAHARSAERERRDYRRHEPDLQDCPLAQSPHTDTHRVPPTLLERPDPTPIIGPSTRSAHPPVGPTSG